MNSVGIRGASVKATLVVELEQAVIALVCGIFENCVSLVDVRERTVGEEVRAVGVLDDRG